MSHHQYMHMCMFIQLRQQNNRLRLCTVCMNVCVLGRKLFIRVDVLIFFLDLTDHKRTLTYFDIPKVGKRLKLVLCSCFCSMLLSRCKHVSLFIDQVCVCLIFMLVRSCKFALLFDVSNTVMFI